VNIMEYKKGDAVICIKWLGKMFIPGKLYYACEENTLKNEQGAFIKIRNHEYFRKATKLEKALK